MNKNGTNDKLINFDKVSDVTASKQIQFRFSPNSWYNRNMMTIVLLIIAYLLGSIPSGLWIGQIFFNINLREHGSGNTGTTNTFRILGKKAGMATFVIDFFKGTLATLLPLIFHVQGVSPIVFGLLAVIGHTFPIFANLRVVRLLQPAQELFLVLLLSFAFTLQSFSLESFIWEV